MEIDHIKVHFIDDLARGKYKFAEMLEEDKKRANSEIAILKRLLMEMESFHKYVKEEKEYFMAMGEVTDRKILTKEQIKEYRIKIYRVDSNLEYVRRRINPSTRLAAFIDNTRSHLNELKATEIATQKASDIINHKLWQSLRTIQNEVESVMKALEKKVEKDLLKADKQRGKLLKDMVTLRGLI